MTDRDTRIRDLTSVLVRLLDVTWPYLHSHCTIKSNFATSQLAKDVLAGASLNKEGWIDKPATLDRFNEVAFTKELENLYTEISEDKNILYAHMRIMELEKVLKKNDVPLPDKPKGYL